MADIKKSFGQDWVENTMTGRAVDAVTGGKLSRAANEQSMKMKATRISIPAEGMAMKVTRKSIPAQTVNRKGKGDREGVGLSDIRSQYAKKPKGRGK